MHHYQALIALFEQTFFADYRTRLTCGDDEPVYLPADDQVPWHRIVFAHGYFASALHEVAHWCIAGEARRRQMDYGYWYQPDGRSATQQAAFERVEVKPQALEWAFSVAAGFPFNVSVDNLHGGLEVDRLAFMERVRGQVVCYLERGFPERAERFISVLRRHYRTPPLAAFRFVTR